MTKSSNGNGNQSKELPKKFYLLSPDGFTLRPDAKLYKSMEDARKYFEYWKKPYEQQGYYSSSNFGKIPIEDLEQYMILHDRPFYDVSKK